MAYIAIKANMSTLIAYLTVSREIQYFVLYDETYEMVGWVMGMGSELSCQSTSKAVLDRSEKESLIKLIYISYI